MERDKAKPSTIKLPETNRASFSSRPSVKTPKEKSAKEDIDSSQLSNSLIKTDISTTAPSVGTPSNAKNVENKTPLPNTSIVNILDTTKNETSNEKVQTPNSNENSFVTPSGPSQPSAGRIGSSTPSNTANTPTTYTFPTPNPQVTVSPNVSSVRFAKKKDNPPVSPGPSITKDPNRTIKTTGSPKSLIKGKFDKLDKPKKVTSPHMSLDSPEKDMSAKTNLLNTSSHDNTIDGDSLGHSALSQPSAKQNTNEFVNYYKQERPKINIWTYLFKNLNNSISQIYTMCDMESSLEFNNGVISTLETAIEDIKKLNKKIELDNMTDTKPITWEIPSITNELQNKQEIENFLEDLENPDTVDFTLLTQLIQDGKMSLQDALVLLVRERALLLDDSTLNLMNNSQGMMSDNISVVSKINPDFSLEYHKDSKDKDGKEESIGAPFQIEEGQDLLRRSRSQTPGRISLVKVINRLNWKLQDKKKEVDEGYASEEYITGENKNKLSEKQQRAEMNRKERESMKQDSLQKEFHKINEARDARDKAAQQQQVKKLEAISKKQGEAEERYEAKLAEKKKKAKNEIDKVNEVAFISLLEKQNKKLTFDQKVHETRERRLNIIEQIKQKQMGRSIKEDAASKRRAALQKETEGKLKSKLEEAEHRRNKIFEEKKKILGEESKKLVDVTNRKKILGFKETPLKKGEEQSFKVRLELLKVVLLEEQQKLNKRLLKKDAKANETENRGRKLSVAGLSSEEEDTSFVRPKRVRSVRSEDADDEEGDITLGGHSILFYEPRSKRKEKAAAQEEENKLIAASKEKAAALKKGKKKKKKKEVDIAPKKEEDDKMKTVYVLIRSFSQPNMKTPKLKDLQLKLEAAEEKKTAQKGQKVMTPSASSTAKKSEKPESTPKTTKDVKEKEKETKATTTTATKHVDGDGATQIKKFSINKAKSIGSSSSEPLHTTVTLDIGRSGKGTAGLQASGATKKERTSVTEKDDHSIDLDSSLPTITSGRDKEKEKEKDAAHGSMLLERIHEQSDNDDNMAHTNSMSEEKDITEEGKEDMTTSSSDDKKVRWCSICDLILEVNAGNDEHIGSKQHRKVKLQYNLLSSDDTNCILEFKTSDLGSKLKTERWNTLKKRCKKIKQRLVTRALKKESSYLAGKEVTSINKQRLQKLSQDLDKQVATQIKDYDVVDNTLKDILKLLENQKEADLHIMRQLKFIPILMEICKRVSVCHKNEMDALLRALDSAIKILAKFCGLIDNRTYMILSNRLVPLVDLLIWCLNRPTKFVYSLTFVPHLFTILGRHLNHRLHIENVGFKEDIIEYIFCSGLIMKLQQKFMSFNGGLDLTTSMGKVPLALLKSVSFLEILTNVVDVDFNTERSIFDPPIVSENIMIALKETEFVGMFTLLASLLLSDGSYLKQPSKVLPQTVLSVAMTTVKFFNNIARIMLEPFQSLLGNREHQEQVCHVFGYLLVYCNHHYDSSEDVKDLLDELILVIGYFCVLNPINQEILGKGMNPIIQKLTALPIPYFTDKRMKDVLFPTLFCAIFQNERNMGIVDQEASKDYLEKYLQSQIQLFPLECITEKEEGHLTPSNTDSGFGLNPFNTQNRNSKPKEMKYLRAPSVSSNTSSTTSLFNVNASNSYNFHLICRFPRNRWDELLQFIHSA